MSRPVSDFSHIAADLFSIVSDNTHIVPRKKLLIVDDAPTNRKFLRKLLELRGHICDEAEDGVEGLDMVRDAMEKQKGETTGNPDSYDIIFMDFMMPKTNGPDATRAIRQLGYKGPIIGVTGNAYDADKATFTNAGNNYYYYY